MGIKGLKHLSKTDNHGKLFKEQKSWIFKKFLAETKNLGYF